MSVVASGILCWRTGDDGPRVLIIHRPHHKDYSFPKGKVDPGEIPSTTAVRETWEETGLRTTLGPYLGLVHYYLPSGTEKIVHYWSSRVPDGVADALVGDFHRNSEVDEIMWMTQDEAKAHLTYAHDSSVLDRLFEKIEQGLADTIPVIVQRHAKAMSRGEWGKSEITRPLTELGRAQAKALGKVLEAWAPPKLHSSPWRRCVATLEPYSQRNGLEIKQRSPLSESDYEEAPELTVQFVEKRVRKATRKHRGLLLCSHRPVLGGVMAALVNLTDGSATSTLMAGAQLEAGAFTVVQVVPSGNEDAPLLVSSVERYRPLPE